VVAQEVYGDGVLKVSTPYFGQNTLTSDVNFDNDYGGQNGGGLNDSGGDRLSDTACDVTRVRLVQFQRNTDEPLVRIIRTKSILINFNSGYYTSYDRKQTMCSFAYIKWWNDTSTRDITCWR
jgi:hypothetical protein